MLSTVQFIVPTSVLPAPGGNVQLTGPELDQDDGRLGQRVRIVLVAVGTIVIMLPAR